MASTRASFARGYSCRRHGEQAGAAKPDAPSRSAFNTALDVRLVPSSRRLRPQQVLLDLADRRPRELVAKLDKSGTRNFASRSAHQPISSAAVAGARAQDDERLDRLVADRVGHADDGGIEDGRVVLEDGLDLAGGDVLAGAFDHVLGAIHELEEAVVASPHVVARPQPAVADRRGRGGRISEVALHQAHTRLRRARAAGRARRRARRRRPSTKRHWNARRRPARWTCCRAGRPAGWPAGARAARSCRRSASAGPESARPTRSTAAASRSGRR